MHTHGGRGAVGILALVTLVPLASACMPSEPTKVDAASAPDPTPSITASPSATPATAVDAPQPSDWFAPSVDITSFQASYEDSSDKLELRIEFADLRKLKHQDELFTQSLTVTSDADPGRDLYVERTDRGTTLVSRTVATLRHYGADAQRCAGADLAVDVDSDVLLLTVPVSCLTRKRTPARFTVWTVGMQVLADGQRQTVGSDRQQTARRVRTG